MPGPAGPERLAESSGRQAQIDRITRPMPADWPAQPMERFQRDLQIGVSRSRSKSGVRPAQESWADWTQKPPPQYILSAWIVYSIQNSAHNCLHLQNALYQKADGAKTAKAAAKSNRRYKTAKTGR